MPDQPHPHVTTIRVRYGETDRMGVVYYAHYLVYLEIARTESLRAKGVRYRDLEDQGYLLAVAEAAIRYVSPARYDEMIDVTTRLTKRTPARLRHDYEIHGEDGRLIVTAHTVLACLDKTGHVCRIPDNLIP